jgi:hypothetical protein
MYGHVHMGTDELLAWSKDARKHADYWPITRGAKLGCGRRGRRGCSVWLRASITCSSLLSLVDPRIHQPPPYVQLSPTYVQSSSLTFCLLHHLPLNHAERYRSRQRSWRSGTWKTLPWWSWWQRHPSWSRTWWRPRSRWRFRTARTGRVRVPSGVAISPDIFCITPHSRHASIFAEGQPASIDARLADSSEDRLILSFKSLSLRQDAMPPRPDYGTKG